MKQLRGFKYRFYPTSAQRLELAQTFGCTRYIFNWALSLRTNSYYQDHVSLSYTDTSNALTKLSTKLVSESQAIYTETLAGKNMMANHKLAKAISDCPKGYRFAYSWGEFLRQLEYKCQWHGRELVAIDRWFPSSKRCNPWGHILDKLPLNIREWTCPSCNSQNLRDLNAAMNIKAVGQTVFACGSSSSGGQSLTDLAILG